MILVNVDKIEQGMVLAQAVRDDRGTVILNEGFVLSPAWSARLRARRIESVYVKKAEGAKGELDAGVEVSQEQLEQAIAAEVEEQFAGTLDQPLMRELAEAAKRYRVRKRSDAT